MNNISVNFLYGTINFINYCTRKITSIFTVIVDPLDISNEPIKFKGRNEYGGYKVIRSVDEHRRRIIHWFYRTVEVPTLDDWENCLDLFNLIEIPSHVIQLYDHNKEPLNKFILIHNITNEFIHYTYENREKNESMTVTVPIGIASLVPERFLFNLSLYSNQ